MTTTPKPAHPLTDAQVEAVANRVALVISNMLDDEIQSAAELCNVELPDWDDDEDAAAAAHVAICDLILTYLRGDTGGE